MAKSLKEDIRVDPLARIVIRYLLIFQACALLLSLILTLTHISSIALIISFLHY
jgi:hypothetical protein